MWIVDTSKMMFPDILCVHTGLWWICRLCACLCGCNAAVPACAMKARGWYPVWCLIFLHLYILRQVHYLPPEITDLSTLAKPPALETLWFHLLSVRTTGGYHSPLSSCGSWGTQLHPHICMTRKGSNLSKILVNVRSDSQDMGLKHLYLLMCIFDNSFL